MVPAPTVPGMSHQNWLACNSLRRYELRVRVMVRVWNVWTSTPNARLLLARPGSLARWLASRAAVSTSKALVRVRR